jgi:uncharacterized membrane protein YccC
MFNVLKPSGWHVGLIRVEDVAIGCAVAVVVSVLLWPNGVAATARAAIDGATDQYLRYLEIAVQRITGRTTESTSAAIDEHRDLSIIAYRTADDAARQYLSESGGSTDQRTPVVRAFNQTTRLRLVADSIADLTPPPNPDTYPHLRSVVDRHASHIVAQLSPGHTREVHEDKIAEEAVEALRSESGDGPLDVATARPLIGASAYLGELEMLYSATPTRATGDADLSK